MDSETASRYCQSQIDEWWLSGCGVIVHWSISTAPRESPERAALLTHLFFFCFLFFFFNVCVRRWSRQNNKKKQSKMYSPKWDRARRMMNFRMSDGCVSEKSEVRSWAVGRHLSTGEREKPLLISPSFVPLSHAHTSRTIPPRESVGLEVTSAQDTRTRPEPLANQLEPPPPSIAPRRALWKLERKRKRKKQTAPIRAVGSRVIITTRPALGAIFRFLFRICLLFFFCFFLLCQIPFFQSSSIYYNIRESCVKRLGCYALLHHWHASMNVLFYIRVARVRIPHCYVYCITSHSVSPC